MGSELSLVDCKLATGASHPPTGNNIFDHTTQYVDDKTDMINLQGTTQSHPKPPALAKQFELLFNAANENIKIGYILLWISGVI